MRTIVLLALLLAAVPAAAQDFSAVVREEKQKLLDAGFTFHVSSGDAGSEQGRCDAAQITWRAAHRLATEGHPVFLIGKSPGQNGCTAQNGNRYSHDAIVFQATCIDVLMSSETANTPAWNLCTNPTVEPSLWRPTFALGVVDAPLPEDLGDQDGDNDGSIDVLVSLMGSLEAQIVKMSGELATKEQLATHDAKVDAKFEEARGWIQTAKNPRTWLYGGGLAGILAILQQVLGGQAEP